MPNLFAMDRRLFCPGRISRRSCGQNGRSDGLRTECLQVGDCVGKRYGILFSGDNVSFARDYVWNARNDKLKRRYFYPINSFNQIILPMTSNFTAFLRPFRAACLFVLLTVCCGGCSDSGSVDETPPADQLALSPSSLVSTSRILQKRVHGHCDRRTDLGAPGEAVGCRM